MNGTGLVPWKEFSRALKKINYAGPLVIEAFDPSFEELNRFPAIITLPGFIGCLNCL